jgi:hypothetical protein
VIVGKRDADAWNIAQNRKAVQASLLRLTNLLRASGFVRGRLCARHPQALAARERRFILYQICYCDTTNAMLYCVC